MTSQEVNASMDRALDNLHRSQDDCVTAITGLREGRRFTRPRQYGWALYIVTNGTPRKVGQARTEGQYRSFLRGGVW